MKTYSMTFGNFMRALTDVLFFCAALIAMAYHHHEEALLCYIITRIPKEWDIA